MQLWYVLFSDEMVKFPGMFLKKAVRERIPDRMPIDSAPRLKRLDPKKGCLVDRWMLRARYPVKVTVVARQWGSEGLKLKTAEPVEQCFYLIK